MAEDTAPVDPATDASVAEDSTAAPAPAEAVATPEAPVAPEAPADAVAPGPEALAAAALAAEKDTDGDLAEDEKSEAKAPKKAQKSNLKANADGVDLTASTVPEVPTVKTAPAPDANAKPLSQPEAAQQAADVSPEAEAALQVADPSSSIDGSGILQQTNQEVLDQLPKNENGQVVLDENGQVVGLAPANQPSPRPGSQA